MNGSRPSKPAELSPRVKGILCILASALGFSLMSVFVKLAGDIPSVQKSFFRNFVTVIVTGATLIRTHTSPKPIDWESTKLLLIRSLVGTAAIWANFYAIDHILLSDANMLNKFSPFAAIVVSAIYLKERPSHAQILAVIVACLGSAFILKPGFSSSFGPSVIGLLGGIGAGTAYALVRKIGRRGENSVRMIFFFSVFSCVTSLPAFFINYTPMSLKQILILFLAGIGGLIGQFGVTRAYLYAPAREISVYEYVQIIFAALFGFILFEQVPDILSVIGYVLICGSGIAMFFYNRRRS